MNKFNLIFSVLVSGLFTFTSCDLDDGGDVITNSGSSCDAPTKVNCTSSFTATDDDISGNVCGALTLNEKAYNLDGVLTVKSGASLTLPAGTKISIDDSDGSNGTNRYIIVERGAKIFINGTNAKPVVMDNPDGFNWGGIVIAGQAPTSNSICTASGEVANIIYGGNVSSDNSGVVSYLVLRNTGAEINSGSEFNGISFYGVGSGTTISNVAVINGEDDGVEFFGGTVNASNLWLEDNQDDSVDVTEGFSGTLNNVVVTFTRDDFNSATEIEKDNTAYSINNFSVYNNGPALNALDVDERGLVQIKRTAVGGVSINNLYQEGFGSEEPASSNNFPFFLFLNGTSSYSNVSINGSVYNQGSNITNGTAVDTSGWTWKNATL